MNSSLMNDFDDYMLSRNIKFLVTVHLKNYFKYLFTQANDFIEKK